MFENLSPDSLKSVVMLMQRHKAFYNVDLCLFLQFFTKDQLIDLIMFNMSLMDDESIIKLFDWVSDIIDSQISQKYWNF